MSGTPFPRTRTVTVDCDCSPEYRRGHGTHHTYFKHQCGCDLCLAAARERDRLVRAHGPATTSVAPVRAHIAALAESGLTVAEIARRAGYGRQTVHYINRYARSCDRYIAEDLLAVTA